MKNQPRPNFLPLTVATTLAVVIFFVVNHFVK